MCIGEWKFGFSEHVIVIISPIRRKPKQRLVLLFLCLGMEVVSEPAGTKQTFPPNVGLCIEPGLPLWSPSIDKLVRGEQ